MEWSLAFDIRMATERSLFDFAQLRIGLCSGFGGGQRLVNLLGGSRATSLLLLSEVLAADEAQRIGLVHRLAESADTLDAQVNELIQKWEALPPEAVAAQKCILAGCSAQQANDEFRKIWKNPHHAEILRRYRS